MKIISKQKINAYFYNPRNRRDAEHFLKKHNIHGSFVEDGLEDADKTGSLEVDLMHDGMYLNIGEYIIINGNYQYVLNKHELNRGFTNA